MNIKNIKLNLMKLSFILIITGALFSVIGFGLIGFDFNRLREEASDDVWYQTIHGNSNNLWYGLHLGENVHIFTIGNSVD